MSKVHLLLRNLPKISFQTRVAAHPLVSRHDKIQTRSLITKWLLRENLFKVFDQDALHTHTTRVNPEQFLLASHRFRVKFPTEVSDQAADGTQGAGGCTSGVLSRFHFVPDGVDGESQLKEHTIRRWQGLLLEVHCHKKDPQKNHNQKREKGCDSKCINGMKHFIFSK